VRLTAPLLIAVVAIVGAVIGYTMWGQHQRLQQERAVTALLADTTAQLRQALTATPTKEIFSRIDGNLRSLKAPRSPELADAAEHYILGAREIVRRRLDAARHAQQAAAGRQALAAHMSAAGGRRGEAWFRTALDLKKRVERDHFDLDITLKALQELLDSLPDAEKRLAPHVQPALLLEEPLRVQARGQARADAERAAAELVKVRRLAEAR
jgi:xanthosine utilization system XapX-like protein